MKTELQNPEAKRPLPIWASPVTIPLKRLQGLWSAGSFGTPIHQVCALRAGSQPPKPQHPGLNVQVMRTSAPLTPHS